MIDPVQCIVYADGVQSHFGAPPTDAERECIARILTARPPGDAGFYALTLER